MKKIRAGLALLAGIMLLGFPLQAGAGDIQESQILSPEEGEPEEGMPSEEGEPGSFEDLIEAEPGKEQEEGEDDAAAEPPSAEDGAISAPGTETDVLTIVCIGCVAAAVVAVISAVLAVRKKGGGSFSRKQGISKTTAEGIPIKLEIYSGRCRNKSALLTLSDCLTIGSDADCDIIFDESDVAPRNSCIRLSGGQVYIEDLNSPQGTALDGMRFQGRNLLRGGEVISIGSVEFCISFLDDYELKN